MPNVIATLQAVIGADISGLAGGLKEADQGLSGFASSMSAKLQNIGGSMTQLGGAMTLLTAPITAFLGTSLKQAQEQQDALSQLTAVLKSTGGAAGVTAKMADELSSSLSKVTRFSDDAVLGAENMLLTFTSIGKDIFPDTTKVVLDMSQALGQDLKSSAIQVGKALNDPIKGVSALQRVGVQFTEAQKDQIKTMVESGNVMGAQTLILKELQREFGGSAEAAGTTFAGKLDILNHRFTELQEKIGGIIMPMIGQFAVDIGGLIDRVSDWIDKNPELAKTILAVAGALAVAGPVLIIVGQAISAIGTIVGVVGAVLGSSLLAPVLAVVGALALLKKAYDDNFLGFKTTVDNAVQSIGSALQLIPFYAGYYLGKIWSVVQPLLQPLIDWFSGSGSDSFGGAVTSAYTTIIKPAIDNVVKLLGGIWAAVSPALTTLYDWFVATGLPEITGFIQGAIDNFIKPLIDTISGIWTAIQPGLQSAFDWFTSTGLPVIGGWINDVLHDHVLPFIDSLLNLWTNVSGPLNDFMNGIKTVFGWVVDNVIAPIVAGIQQVIDIINQLRGVTTQYQTSGGGGSRGFGDDGGTPLLPPVIETPGGSGTPFPAATPHFGAGAGRGYGALTAKSVTVGTINLHFPNMRDLTQADKDELTTTVLMALARA